MSDFLEAKFASNFSSIADGLLLLSVSESSLDAFVVVLVVVLFFGFFFFDFFVGPIVVKMQ